MIPPHLADLPPRSESDQAGFFADVQVLTELSGQRSTIVERVIDLAGMRVCLRFHGDVLERLLMPALSHRLLDANSEAAGVTIDVWDSAASGVQISEKLPLIAKQFKNLSIIRSLTTKEGDHRRALMADSHADSKSA